MFGLFFSGLLSYLVGMKMRTSRGSHARDTTLTFFVIYLSPLKPKSCAGHNTHTVRDDLIIFGRDIYQVKQECHLQERQRLLCNFF